MLIRTQYKVWVTGHVTDALGSFDTLEQARNFALKRSYKDAELIRVEFHSVEKTKDETIKTK